MRSEIVIVANSQTLTIPFPFEQMNIIYQTIATLGILSLLGGQPLVAHAQPPHTLVAQNSADDLFDQGLTKSRQGDFRGAIDDYTAALQINPNFSLAYNNRGNARSRLKDYQGAINDFTQAIQINRNWGNLGIASAYNNRGNAYAALGELQRGIVDYNQAIRLDSNNANAYYNRGLAYREQGRKRLALQDFQKAAELYQQQGRQNDYQDAINQIGKLQ